ncbi:TPA: hypothetical protein OBR09_004798, partial [Escherichia coli]|nr:hypothetical protein [Escherichia coli]
TPTAEGSQVSNTSINDELNNGTSVTILTNSAVAGSSQLGNITVNADITKTKGNDATLTLNADGNINVNSNITSSAGKLNVNLAAANTSRTGTITLGNNVSITTNGGNITAGAANASNSVTINVTNTTLNTTNNSDKGDITLTADRINVRNANITTGNFTLNATANGADFNNVTLMAVHDINLTGNSTSGRNKALWLNGTTLNASQNVTLTGSGGTVELTRTNVTSQKGSISINSSSTVKNGIFINSGTLNAAGNVNINGTGKLSQVAGASNSFVHIQNATITSSTGNITIDGNVSNIESAVFFRDVTLNASKGNISIRGTSDYAAKHDAAFQGGTVWLYNTNMTAQNIDINATNTNAALGDTYIYGDALYLAGNLTFTGNTTITATADRGAAILFGSTTNYGPSILNMTFSNGSVVMNATNNGTTGGGIPGTRPNAEAYKSAISQDLWSKNPVHVNISLSNSNLTICASSENADGIYGSNINSVWNITGTGNASITGISQHGNGVSLKNLNINASGLNGTTTVSGIAKGNGNGVDISNSTLINVTVNGNGTDGSGVNISGNLTSSG